MKMRKLIISLLTALVATSSLVLWSCASEPQPSNKLNPSGSEIEKALVTKLPAFTRVSSLSIVSILSDEAKENPGNDVVWQARIRATITATTDTFALENEGTNEISEVTFVEPVKRSGESVEVFGKCVSELKDGAWRTTFELEDQSIDTLGQPLSSFGPKKVIARGSKDEKQYLADKQNAEIRNAKIRILEGTISGYECGDNCYLIITDKKGKKHTGLCHATFCNASWAWQTMPARYKGKRVRVTVGKGTQIDGEGDVMDTMDAFTKIQFLK